MTQVVPITTDKYSNQGKAEVSCLRTIYDHLFDVTHLVVNNSACQETCCLSSDYRAQALGNGVTLVQNVRVHIVCAKTEEN